MYEHRLRGTRLTSDLCTLHNTSFLLQTVTVPQIKNYEIADPTNPIYTRLAKVFSREIWNTEPRNLNPKCLDWGGSPLSAETAREQFGAAKMA